MAGNRQMYVKDANRLFLERKRYEEEQEGSWRGRTLVPGYVAQGEESPPEHDPMGRGPLVYIGAV
jgi:hypothetical protein